MRDVMGADSLRAAFVRYSHISNPCSFEQLAGFPRTRSTSGRFEVPTIGSTISRYTLTRDVVQAEKAHASVKANPALMIRLMRYPRNIITRICDAVCRRYSVG